MMCCDVSLTWCLRAVGANSYGQLANGNQDDVFLPQMLVDLPSDVVSVHGGGGHTLLVTEYFPEANRRCYACGSNNKGQLGIGNLIKDKAVTIRKHLAEPLASQKIQKVACGWDHSMVIIEGGTLYSFGSNSFSQLGNVDISNYTASPKLVPHLTNAVDDVACGMRHSIILSGGEVYTCGAGKKGQLGHCTPDGTTVVKSTQFEKVCLPSDHGKPVKLVAGAYHSAVITDQGAVIVWGDNKHGQLAMEPKLVRMQATPTAVQNEMLGKEKVLELHSGWTHMLALTESGSVYTWGRAQYGQLGITTSSQDVMLGCQWQPQVLTIKNPKQIACGSEHNLLISDKDELYSWGWNEHGMCGSGNEVYVLEPTKLRFFEGQKAKKIRCGAGHSFSLVEKS